MPRRRYEKLAVNAGINGPSALARLSNGATLDGPGGEAAREAAREVARVARADGVTLDEDAAVDAVERVAADTAANRSSMCEDVAADRRTEVDAIYGAAIDRADRFGVPVPTCRAIASLIRAWEVGIGVRPGEDTTKASEGESWRKNGRSEIERLLQRIQHHSSRTVASVSSTETHAFSRETSAITSSDRDDEESMDAMMSGESVASRTGSVGSAVRR